MKIEPNSLWANCSEAVFRFGDYRGEVDTSGGEEALKDFIAGVKKEARKWQNDYGYGYTLSEVKRKRLIAYDNIGGGADFDFLARLCYAILEEVYKGKKVNLDKVYDKDDGKAVEIKWG